jgi:hypothetical protein
MVGQAEAAGRRAVEAAAIVLSQSVGPAIWSEGLVELLVGAASQVLVAAAMVFDRFEAAAVAGLGPSAAEAETRIAAAENNERFAAK